MVIKAFKDKYMEELNQDFLLNMKNLLKDDYAEFVAEYKKPPIKGLRVNTEKCSCEELQRLLPQLSEKIPYAEGFYIGENEKLGASPYHHAGLFYIQEPSAMQPALSTAVQAGSLVLDMCASPGGKSGQLAEMVKASGLLVSNEIITARAKVLKENMDRMGYTNVVVTSTTPQNITRIGAIFDCVFVDAPCSGEGMFRREPSAIEEWNAGINKMNSERQLELLGCATKLVRAGGKIVYSTCTFSRLENEDVVEQFLANNPNFTLAEVSEELLPYSMSLGDERLRRVMPHKNRGEGQFYAVLQNVQPPVVDNRRREYLEELKSSERRIVEDFVCKYTNLRGTVFKSYNGNVFVCPNREINTKGIYVLKYGVTLGKIENKRLVPHHNFFTAFGRHFKCKVNITSEVEILKYLRGEQLQIEDCQASGYCAVCYNGYVVGGGKVSGGCVNNLYPKYLRIN